MKALKLPKLSMRAAPKLRLPKHASLLKVFFLTRALREKVLLLAFILIVTVTWLSSVAGRTSKFRSHFKETSTELETQAEWLKNQARIDANAKAAVEHLDPAKTYDGVRLQSEIVSILQRVGITTGYSADPAVSERASVFTKHSIQVTIRNVEYAALVKFYLEIIKQTPYIGFDQVNITVPSNNNNRNIHNATMRITSVELVK
ncbi:MAG: hypothetical protein QM715_12355 [Nibricoccus sp.]